MRSSLTFRVAIVLASLTVLASLAPAQYAGSQPPPSDLAKGFNSINQGDLRKWLGYLAGPECAGRGHLQPGYLKAADYVAARFKEFGLKPGGDNGTYFQSVPFITSTLKPEESYFEVSGSRIPFGTDMSLSGAIADQDWSAPVLFLNFALAKKMPTDLYLENKTVIVIGAPSRDDRRALQAAKLVLTVSENVPAPRPTTARGETPEVSGRIKPAAAKQLAAKLGVGEDIFDDTKVVGTQARVLIGSDRLRMVAKVDREDKSEPNVIGILEGSDPILRGETVGVGAHLDHLGERNGLVYYGADDDGSGTVAVLSIAKAMSLNPVKPKRSIVFMLFCAEEVGLVGSRYQAANPVIPLDKMLCELQLDMIGRNSYGPQNGDRNRIDIESENVETMRLVGSKRISMELHDLIIDLNKHTNFKFKYDSEDVYTRSDHYSFAAKGVPIAFMFDGFTPDYHQATDTIDKINFEKIMTTAKLYYLVAMRASAHPTHFKRNPPVEGGQ